MAALEVKLGQGKLRPVRPTKHGTRLCADGVKRGKMVALPINKIADWFWPMIVKNKKTGCWEWIGPVGSRGYGQFAISRKNYSCHRFAARLVLGFFPKDWICHTCDNKICVNPSHLFIGTATDNRRDCRDKGRLVAPKHERNGQSKITKHIAKRIRFLVKRGGITHTKIAAMFGISQPQVSGIGRGVYWSDGPCLKTKAAKLEYARRNDPAFQ